jgi:hypothetical protein
MAGQDRVSWELGWDFAHFSWPIPDDADKDFCDGYRAFRHDRNRPIKKQQSIYDKKWLQLRMNAWRRGKPFNPEVTPKVLEILMPEDKCCPVTQVPFTFATQEETDWSIERANNDEGYIRENLIVISARANAAKSNLSFERICQFANGSLENNSLTQREWQRLAELVAPMHEEPGLRGVLYLGGQKVATGVAMSPIAELQKLLADCAIEEAVSNDRQYCPFIFSTLMNLICRSKKEARAFKRLIVAIRQRAKHIRQPDRLWATPRVHKKLEEFAAAMGGSTEGILKRIGTGLNEYYTMIDALREAHSSLEREVRKVARSSKS